MAEIRTTSSTGGQKGVKLARFDLIPPGPHRELAVHFGRGARKYDDHQWRNGYEWSKSIAALERHLNDFKAGKDYDICSNDPQGCSFTTADSETYEPTEPDTCYNHTGSHHMAAVAWHAFALLEFKDWHPDHDDRFKLEVAEVELEERVDVMVWGNPEPITFKAANVKIETMAAATGIPLEDLRSRWVADFDDETGSAKTLLDEVRQMTDDRIRKDAQAALNRSWNRITLYS